MMTPSHSPRWDRISELFDRCVELDAASRERLLGQECADDPELRSEVEALLRASDRPGPLDKSVAELAQDVAAEATETGLVTSHEGNRRIGPWRLLDTLGAGGMGRVFLAERAEGKISQRVALKVLRWELADSRFVDRFEREQQILAQLEHPNIARLIDAGLSDDKLPYLAMEYVDGVPIDEAVRRDNPDLETRLQLWLQVAEAVEFAHRNLVVHRDLKPSNILVDTTGRVRLLDFGIARIVDESVADNARTQTQHAMVTPSCAAPEQLRGGAITTATDVWALGVLLYQLLSGTHPFADDELTHETARRILEEEATKASRVAVDFGRRLRGDLDNILSKAMAKAPADRYGSVEAFAEDIHRHLSGQPVLAHSPSRSYRARKWVARHRRALTVAAGIIVTIGGLVSYYTYRVSQERDHALSERAKTEEVKKFVESLFIANDPLISKGEETTAREMLDQGAVRIEEELSAQPEIAAEMHQVIGELYASLGIYELARGHLRSASDLRREVLGSDSPRLAESLLTLANVLREQDDLDGAILALRESLEIYRKHSDDRVGIASALNELGLTLSYRGDYEEAQENLTRAAEIFTEALGENHRRTATALNNLGLAIKWGGDSERAEPIYRKVLEIRRVDPGRLSSEYAVSLDNLGVLLGQRGDYEESEELFREALDIRKQILGEEHPDVAMNLNNLATLFRVQGRMDEAEPIYRQVLELNRRIHGSRHRTVATNLHNLGSLLVGRGDFEGAKSAFEEALDIRREVLGPDHIEVAVTQSNLVRVLVAQGKLGEAEPLSENAVRVARAAVGEDSPQLASILCQRGELLLDMGRLTQAKQSLEEALSIQKRALEPDHWEVGQSSALLGECMADLGDEDAESLLQEGYDILRNARGDEFAGTQRAHTRLLEIEEQSGER